MAEVAASTSLTLMELENELSEITGADWYPLGVQLGLRPATLREIQRNYLLDTERCKQEVLHLWLHSAPEVSWKSLAQAVEALGGYDSLALELRRKIPPAPKPPSAPTIVSVEATSSTSISVQWAASEKDGGSPITGFVVEYHAASGPPSSFETQVVARDVFSTTLDGLTPSIEYDVRVRGENAVGRSDSSATIRTKTDELAPPSCYHYPPPQHLYSGGSGYQPTFSPFQLQQGFVPPFGMLHASGYQIPSLWQLYSGGGGQQWPTFTPSQISQQGFVPPQRDLLQNSGVGGYPPIYAQNDPQEKLVKTLRESIEQHDVDSFHRQLDELEGLLQNSERMKGLLETEGILCYAAYVGSNPVVETLIQKGVDVNTMSTVPEHPEYFYVKSSPLHWAADKGHASTVKCLIEKGAKINDKDNKLGMTPLHQAAGGGHVDIVEYLIRMGGDIHSKDCGGKTPLYQAAAKGHVDTVQYLIEAGGDIHSKDDEGCTPLHYAAAMGHADTLQYLAEAGGDIHSKDDNGMTPLHRAAVVGHVDAVQYLIEVGGDIHSKDDKGMTPLHSVAMGGDAGTAQILIEKGADINIKDNNGDTPLDVAAEFRREEVVAYLKRAADPKMLRESDSIGLLQEQRQSSEETAALRTALKRYTVKAKPTGIELGSGTYGRVIELLSAGEIVAGKVFKILSYKHQQMLKNELFGELSLMTQVHHPTVVQCKGVCFLENETMPALLMERLMSSLHAYLLKPANLNTALEKKLAILCDVANGLLYLHSHTPAIIHRDLTGNNVLLDPELRAKISDFGNARLMDLDPEATPGIFTSLPGTPDYMPPEAQGDSAKCGPSLDVFSFGHLSLFTINQSPVHPLLPSTYIDAKGEVHGRSEVKRREQYLDKAEQLLGRKHLVVVLIKKCLHNDPALRPLTEELETRLQDILITMKSPSQSTTPQQLAGGQITSGTEESPATASFTPQPPSTPAPVDIHGVESTDGITVIDEDDLHDVRSAVAGLAGKWQDLGISLRLHSGDLDAILSASAHSPSDCLRKVLTLWLRQSYNVERFGKPTWRRLVEAVEDPVGGNNRALALKIAAEHPAVKSGNKKN